MTFICLERAIVRFYKVKLPGSDIFIKASSQNHTNGSSKNYIKASSGNSTKASSKNHTMVSSRNNTKASSKNHTKANRKIPRPDLQMISGELAPKWCPTVVQEGDQKGCKKMNPKMTKSWSPKHGPKMRTFWSMIAVSCPSPALHASQKRFARACCFLAFLFLTWILHAFV